MGTGSGSETTDVFRRDFRSQCSQKAVPSSLDPWQCGQSIMLTLLFHRAGWHQCNRVVSPALIASVWRATAVAWGLRRTVPLASRCTRLPSSFVYLSGYTNGNLLDPTLEVNDSWKPYFTISLMQPSRGFTGDLLSQVLLVDPVSGDIQSFAPQDVPSWVDRVMPASTVTDYLTWWGKYENAPWFNPSGSGQQSPSGDPELVYNDVDQPVWLVPMTSSSGGDNSSTGIFLFNTRANEAKFYPLSGLAVGDTVTNAFQSNPHNIRNYSVSSVQLYSIYGEPTWVAIFVQSASIGSTFQAVGFLDARDVQGANVQMESSRDAALSDYNGWLASHGNSAMAVLPRTAPRSRCRASSNASPPSRRATPPCTISGSRARVISSPPISACRPSFRWWPLATPSPAPIWKPGKPSKP